MEDVEVSMEQILNSLDHALEGKTNVKPSEAWIFRENVRSKYELPESGYRWADPVLYIKTMKALLHGHEIEIKDKHNFSQYFRQNQNNASPNTTAPDVFHESTLTPQESSNGDWQILQARANQLAHETVHALQNTLSPDIPHDLAEKEAYYYQLLTPEEIIKHKDDPESFALFLNTIQSTIIHSTIKNEK